MSLKDEIINNLDYDISEMLQYADSYSPSYLIEHLESIMKQFYPKVYDFSNLTEEEQNDLYINIAKEIKTFIEEHKDEAIYQEAISLEDFLKKDDSIGEETKLDEQLMASNRERGFFDINHKIYVTEPGETHSQLLKRKFNIGNGRDSRENVPDNDFAYGVILPDDIYLIEPGSINSKTVMQDIYDNGISPSKIYFYDRFDNNYLVRLANNYDEFINNYLDDSILSERVALDDLLSDDEIDEDIKDYIRNNPDKYLPWTLQLDELSSLKDSVGDVHGIDEYADMSQRDYGFVIINHEVIIDDSSAHTELLNKYLDEEYFKDIEHPSEEEMEELNIDNYVFGAIIDDVVFVDESSYSPEEIIKDLKDNGIKVNKVYVYSNEYEITRLAKIK